jgi:hypothetical protein
MHLKYRHSQIMYETLIILQIIQTRKSTGTLDPVKKSSLPLEIAELLRPRGHSDCTGSRKYTKDPTANTIDAATYGMAKKQVAGPPASYLDRNIL